MKSITTKPNLSSKNHVVTILGKELLSPSVILLTVNNPGVAYAAGQHVIISFQNQIYDREYSIFSGEGDDQISLLIKIVDEGYFTPLLLDVEIGEQLNFRGPHGKFTIDLLLNEKKKHYLMATGTGIAPFVSFQRTYHDLIDFEVIHGVRNIDGATFPEVFDNYKLCVSQDAGNELKDRYFAGRITNYLPTIQIDMDAVFYLCGNFDMIYDVETYLVSIGVPHGNIFKEVYF